MAGFVRALGFVALGLAAFGLVGTKSIAKGDSRRPLDAITSTEGFEIFEAFTNEPWTVEGADVRVAIVCARPKSDSVLRLNGQSVIGINSDLTPRQQFGTVTDATPIAENANVAFQGVKLVGSFDLTGDHLTCSSLPAGSFAMIRSMHATLPACR